MTQILIVEDDKSMRNLLKTLLEMEQFQVSVVDPQESSLIISSIRENQPDIVFMDVNLKGISGLSILESIRVEPGIKSTKVIMTSGEDLRDPCLSAGANDFLLKPYMPAELITKLRNLA